MWVAGGLAGPVCIFVSGMLTFLGALMVIGRLLECDGAGLSGRSSHFD